VRLILEIAGETLSFGPDEAPVEMGRLPSHRISINHPSVSRTHGRFVWKGGFWSYEDQSRFGAAIAAQDGTRQKIHGSSIRLPAVCELFLAEEDGPVVQCRIAADSDSSNSRDIFLKAAQAQARGDFKEALDGFLTLARRSPPIEEALSRAAQCCEARGLLPEAIIWASRYSFHRPHDPSTWKLLARLHCERGELDDARACLSKLRELDWSDPEIAVIEERISSSTEGAAVLGMSTMELLGPEIPHELETPHFHIVCDFAVHGRLLPDIAKSLEAAAAKAAGFIDSPGEKINVQLLSRAAAEGEIPVLGEKSAAAACGENGISIYLPPAKSRACRDAPYLASLALHEVVHAFLIDGGVEFPWWLHEGLAQTASLGGAPREVCVPVPDSPPDLSGYESRPASQCIEAAYVFSHLAVSFLLSTVGKDGLRAIIADIASGTTVAQALCKVELPYEMLSNCAWHLWKERGPTEAFHNVTVSLYRRLP